MTWAFKRQFFYILILVIFFSALGFMVSYPSLNKAPTCSDNKQNGTETGIDCGGSCIRACLAQVDKISVHWARAFRVVPGRYNAVAYLENHNKNVAIRKIRYKFNFRDGNNIYIGKREGSAYVPPGGRFAIFEPAIDLGNSIPVYTTFEFTQTPEWTTVAPERISGLSVLVSNINLEGEDASPRLSATIRNNSLFIIPEMNVISILYDANGNAISASRTYVETLAGGEERRVDFTWPEPMPGAVTTKEIIPIYNIFSVKLK